MLDELRRKPREVRRLYAFWGAAGITTLIASVWLVAMVAKISSLEDLPVNNTEQTAGAISQFMSKARERFGAGENKEPEEERDVVATSTSPFAPRPSITPSTPTSPTSPGVLISTTSPSTIRVATSTAQ